MTEHIINSIKEAQLVLIGIGEEFDLKKLIRQDKRYQEVIEGLANEWLIPFVEKAFLVKAGNEYLEAYKQLAHCLQDKNYFIVFYSSAETKTIKSIFFQTPNAFA